jgi:hypothetical protein
MDDNFTNINVIHKDYLGDFENKFIETISEKVDLGDYVLIFFNKLDFVNEDDQSTHNVSIGVAAAITAYARIHMSQFKNNPNFKLFYSDTDSIYIDKPLPDYMISNTILGKMKLENTLTEAIFLAPKMYLLETIDGNIIYKVKGLKHEVELTKLDF